MWADPSVVEDAKSYLTDAPNVTVVAMPINDGWLRDWGPTCIARTNPETGKREVAGVHWDYDCYGAPGKIKGEAPAGKGRRVRAGRAGGGACRQVS